MRLRLNLSLDLHLNLALNLDLHLKLNLFLFEPSFQRPFEKPFVSLPAALTLGFWPLTLCFRQCYPTSSPWAAHSTGESWFRADPAPKCRMSL